MNYMVIGIQICGFGSNKAGGYHFASSAITSMLLNTNASKEKTGLHLSVHNTY